MKGTEIELSRRKKEGFEESGGVHLDQSDTETMH